MKYILFFLTLFLFFSFGHTQITNNETVICNKNITQNSKVLVLLKKKKKIIIPQNKEVEIYFKDSSEKSKGAMTILNDSTILVNGSTIYLSQILKIKTKLKTRGAGVTLLLLTGASAGLSIYSFYQLTNSSSIYDIIGFGVLTFASGGLSLGLLPPSVVLISNGVNKYYNIDGWTFSIE